MRSASYNVSVKYIIYVTCMNFCMVRGFSHQKVEHLEEVVHKTNSAPLHHGDDNSLQRETERIAELLTVSLGST